MGAAAPAGYGRVVPRRVDMCAGVRRESVEYLASEAMALRECSLRDPVERLPELGAVVVRLRPHDWR